MYRAIEIVGDKEFVIPGEFPTKNHLVGHELNAQRKFSDTVELCAINYTENTFSLKYQVVSAGKTHFCLKMYRIEEIK